MEKKDYRLAAIVFTDIVGFSRMMEKDEKGTLQLLHMHNDLIQGIVAKRGGTVIKTIGDAFMLDFRNTVDALQCAMDIQYSLHEYNKDHRDLPLVLRIGIHLGDIYFYENDALGEGINIASRLQAAAHPGCICISQDVYNLVLNKVDFTADKLGKMSLKNISKEIHAYEIATPNVEFFPNQQARRIIDPEKAKETDTEITPASHYTSGPIEDQVRSSTADERLLKKTELKRKIFEDIKQAGRRLSADQMLVRYGSEGDIAKELIRELCEKGILLDKSTDARAPGDSSTNQADRAPGYMPKDEGLTGSFKELGSAFLDIGRKIEREVSKEIDGALERKRQREAQAGSSGQAEAEGQSRRETRHRHNDSHVHVAGVVIGGDKDSKDSHEATRSTTQAEAPGKIQGADWEEYRAQLIYKAQAERRGFFGHLIPFIGVNAGLMFINMQTTSFPWALFPLGGWGIGLLTHLATVMQKNETARRAARLQDLDNEEMDVFRKMQKNESDFFAHFASNVSVILFLFMINLITSPAHLWAAIPGIFMGVGLASHWFKFITTRSNLSRQFKQLRARTGKRRRNAASTIKEDTTDYGPWTALVEEAKAARAAIFERMDYDPDRPIKKKRRSDDSSPIDDDMVPALNAYVDQVQFLALKANEVARIVELIPTDALAKDKAELTQKIEAGVSPNLEREYKKSIGEIERQEKSWHDLKEQQELMVLRMRSSVNNLKQMHIDMARLSNMTDDQGKLTETIVRDKTAELNRHLDDLRAGYQEIGILEDRAE